MRKLQTVLGDFTFKTTSNRLGIAKNIVTPDLLINLGNLQIKNINIFDNEKVNLEDFRSLIFNPLVENNKQFKTFKLIHPSDPKFYTLIELEEIGAFNNEYYSFNNQKKLDIFKTKWVKVTYTSVDGEIYTIMFQFNLVINNFKSL